MPLDRDGPVRDARPRPLAICTAWRQDKRFLSAIMVLVMAVELTASLVLPLLVVPDELPHADLVVAAPGYMARGWPGGDARLVDAGVGAAGARLRVRPHQRVADQALDRDDRPPLIEDEPTASMRPNRMTKHPPLYYLAVNAVASAVDAVWPGHFTADAHLLLYRWVSALFLVPLPLICAAVARLLGGDSESARVAALLPVCIPGLVVRDGALINNDALLVLTGGLAILFSLELARGNTSRWVPVIAGGAAGLALFTKVFGVAVVPVLALGLLAGARRRPLRSTLRYAAVSSIALLAAGGWFWIRNILGYGQVYVAVTPRSPAENFVPDWSYWIVNVVRITWAQFWGGTWVLHENRYGWWLSAATAIVIVGAVVGVFARERRRPSQLLLRVSALSPALVMAMIVYPYQARRYPVIGRIAGVQGRYFFVALAGLLPLAALGWRLLTRRSVRLSPWLVLFAAGITFVSLWSVLDRFWGPSALTPRESLESLLAWTPVSPLAVLLLALVTLGTFALVFRESLRDPVTLDVGPPSA